jgi:hypothetical protein
MIVQIADAHDPVNARFRVVRLPAFSGYLEAVIHELIDCASEPDEINIGRPCYHFALTDEEEALLLLVEPHKLPVGSRQFLQAIFGALDEPAQERWQMAQITAQDSRGLSLPFPGTGNSAYLMGMRPASPE